MSLGRWIMLAASLFAVLPTAPPGVPPALKRFEFARIEMGTKFRIVLYADDAKMAHNTGDRAFQRIAELDALLSDYRNDSELSRVCEKAFEAPQVVSPELYRLLKVSIDLSRRTGGRFDVTIQPLSDLWRQARRQGKLPAAEEIEARRRRVGYRDLLLNPWTMSVRFAKPGMRLDLGAIAKGYAADEALRVLSEAGIDRALVDAGGDVRVGRAPPGKRGWTVSIEPGGSQLPLHQQAIATSGDDHQFLEADGRRYSHIVDPATGLGLTSHRLVTVVAPNAMTADALATALSLCDVESGLRLADETPGTFARIEDRLTGRLWLSPRFPR